MEGGFTAMVRPSFVFVSVLAALVSRHACEARGAKIAQDPLEGPGPLPAGVDGPLIAISRNKLKKFKEFFAKSPNARHLANNRTDTGSTYLMEAAAHGRPEMVRFLLEQGAEPDATKPDDKKTPLILAAILGYVPVIDVILESGADWQANVDAVDSQGMTALMYAAASPKASVAKALIRGGASTAIRQKPSGMTALMYGAFNGHVDTITAIVKDGGANLEQRDDTARTALMWAALGKRTAALRFLVESGADRLAVDSMGLSAADYQRFAPAVDPKDTERRHKEGAFSKWEARNRLAADGDL